MASRRTRPHRFLLPTILAAVLAAEITGLALARSLPLASTDAPAAASVSAQVAQPAADSGRAIDDASRDASRDGISTPARPRVGRPAGLVVTPPPVAPTSTAHAVATAARAKPASTAGTSTTRATAYRGTNHVWIPSLGIDKGIQSFPCSRNRPPDAGVYRWGCAGRNNVYLLSHAWSTFKPLHDAYTAGRLRKGMQVVYADGGGRVHTYAVIWWKVVAPTTAASWAWASLSTPSMTLQTCVGANSAYRLMIRLVRIR
jgi:hypothetical protein